MGVTVDLIPRLPDETPDEVISRVYAEALSGESPPGVAPGVLDGWRAEVLLRLRELFPRWEVEGCVDDLCALWADGYLWRIEMNDDDITCRTRRHVDLLAPAATDAEVLAAFEGLDTIVHWPHDRRAFAPLTRPATRPSTRATAGATARRVQDVATSGSWM